MSNKTKQEGAFSDDSIKKASRTLARTYFREAGEPDLVQFDESSLADVLTTALDAMNKATRRAVDDYNMQKAARTAGNVQ